MYTTCNSCTQHEHNSTVHVTCAQQYSTCSQPNTVLSSEKHIFKKKPLTIELKQLNEIQHNQLHYEPKRTKARKIKKRETV